MTNRHRILLAVTVGAMMGCRGFDAPAPNGFATFADRSQFRAVSSDGVVYRVHREKNEPKAELEFWREALKKRMLEAGYAYVNDGEIKAGNSRGYRLELAAPVGTQDYSYAVYIFTQGEHIIVAEAAGEVTRFRAHRDDLLAAVAHLQF